MHHYNIFIHWLSIQKEKREEIWHSHMTKTPKQQTMYRWNYTKTHLKIINKPPFKDWSTLFCLHWEKKGHWLRVNLWKMKGHWLHVNLWEMKGHWLRVIFQKHFALHKIYTWNPLKSCEAQSTSQRFTHDQCPFISQCKQKCSSILIIMLKRQITPKSRKN